MYQEGRLLGITVAKIGNTNIGFFIPRRLLDQFIRGQLHDIDLEVERKWLHSERWVYKVSTTCKILLILIILRGGI